MSRDSLIKQLKQRNPNLNISDLKDVVDIFSECVVFALKSRKNIEIRGFGSFIIKKIKEKHTARNPKTGELIYVPEKNKVRFRPSQKLKSFINE